tara:strand:- start:1118 stop:1519 length:402 start_codon:yes stop_codon:yes gene_type:complete
LKSIITINRVPFKNKGLHLTQSSFANQTPKLCDETISTRRKPASNSRVAAVPRQFSSRKSRLNPAFLRYWRSPPGAMSSDCDQYCNRHLCFHLNTNLIVGRLSGVVKRPQEKPHLQNQIFQKKLVQLAMSGSP